MTDSGSKVVQGEPEITQREQKNDGYKQPNRLTTSAQPGMVESLANYFNNKVIDKLHSQTAIALNHIMI